MTAINNPIIFNTNIFLLRRKIALLNARIRPANQFFLHDFSIDGNIETIATIKHDLKNVLEIFSNNNQMANKLSEMGLLGNKISNLIEFEPAEYPIKNLDCLSNHPNLPLKEQYYDLIISNSGLNWINDVPNLLVKIRQSLAKNGNFIASFLGGQTLWELRKCFLDAEVEMTNGASMRINPKIEPEMAASLLTRAGFKSPVSSKEVLNIRYDNVFGLFRDIKGMGEAAAFLDKNIKPLNRHLIAHVADLYQARHGDENGRINATFEFVTISGWAD